MLEEKNYYKISEIAKEFNVSVKTIYRWINTGQIKCVKLAGSCARIPHSQLAKILPPEEVEDTPGTIQPTDEATTGPAQQEEGKPDGGVIEV